MSCRHSIPLFPFDHQQVMLNPLPEASGRCLNLPAFSKANPILWCRGAAGGTERANSLAGAGAMMVLIGGSWNLVPAYSWSYKPASS